MDQYVYPPYNQGDAPYVPQYAYNPYSTPLPYQQFQGPPQHAGPPNNVRPSLGGAQDVLTPQGAGQQVFTVQPRPNSATPLPPTLPQHGSIQPNFQEVNTSNSSTPQLDGSDDDDDDDLIIEQYVPGGARTGRDRAGRVVTHEPSKDREYYQSEEGVAELRAKWQQEWDNKPLPPPPPQMFATSDEASDACRAFAKQNGYGLVTKSTRKDKDGVANRVIMTCIFGGQAKPKHTSDPEKRTRNRQSRKLGCPVRIRLQKKRFSREWIVGTIHGQHNHGIDRPQVDLKPSEFPELETALHQWHVAELAKGNVVHGSTIKARARALWTDMPQYSGRPPPDLETTKWLDFYRLRYDMPGKPTKRLVQMQVIDLNDPEAVAAAQATTPFLPPSKEDRIFAGLDNIFPSGNIIEPIKSFVKDYMSRYDASHDWNHILRVFGLAKQILLQENQSLGQMKCDPQAVFLTALLHDIGDHKYAKPGENPENMIAETLLEHDAPVELAMKVQLLAKNVSYSNEMKNKRVVKAVIDANPELAIVQDADRLDAIGAIGIGRSFTFGGAKQPDRGMDGTIEHFTDKLETLEALMKTETGRKMARQRTERLKTFRSWWEEENAMFT